MKKGDFAKNFAKTGEAKGPSPPGGGSDVPVFGELFLCKFEGQPKIIALNFDLLESQLSLST